MPRKPDFGDQDQGRWGVPRPEKSALRTKIARIRLERGLLQRQMVDLTGIPRATYERLEQGQLTNPRIRHLANIALVLQVPLEDIIEDEWRGWYQVSNQTPDRPRHKAL